MGAYEYWDKVWRSDTGRAAWSKADPWVDHWITVVRAAGKCDALDLGSGIGRHTLAMARAGFTAHGVDASESAVVESRRLAAAEGLPVTYSVTDFTRLPFDSGSFDYVVAYNVVYHGDEPRLALVLDEVRRVLRPGGVYQATMLSKRNRQYGLGIETSPNTFRQPQATDDKVHDHLYVDEHDLLRLHTGFRLLSLADREHEAAGSFHWHCVFESDGGRRGDIEPTPNA